MIDQEQAARTLINLIDVVHQENWVLLNKEDMASKTEEYYINFFKGASGNRRDRNRIHRRSNR